MPQSKGENSPPRRISREALLLRHETVKIPNEMDFVVFFLKKPLDAKWSL
jgi:hypothetical protein